jgi:hypothetical protein
MNISERGFYGRKSATGWFFWLAVRGIGERVRDVGDILLAQPAQQGLFVL